jgi:hypothetical protein
MGRKHFRDLCCDDECRCSDRCDRRCDCDRRDRDRCDCDDCCKRDKRDHRKLAALLKFSGLVTAPEEGPSLFTYLADAGNTVLDLAPGYPVPHDFEVKSFAANITTTLVVQPAGIVQFQLIKNGALVVASITYNPGDPNSVKVATFAPVQFLRGETIDVRVFVATGAVATGTFAVSAMVGP